MYYGTLIWNHPWNATRTVAYNSRIETDFGVHALPVTKLKLFSLLLIKQPLFYFGKCVSPVLDHGPLFYCAFHKHANSKVQKPPSQLCFSLLSIIITITSNKPENTETHKTDRNLPITNHKPWPFEPVKVKFCFLRGPLRWLTAAKNAIVSWLLNFRIRMFMKSAVRVIYKSHKFDRAKTDLASLAHRLWRLSGNYFEPCTSN